MSAAAAPRRAPRSPSNPVAAHLLRHPTSIGNVEALAGLNPQDQAERQELWNRYRHLFAQPGTAALDAVMADCKKAASQRLERGEFCLFPPPAALATA